MSLSRMWLLVLFAAIHWSDTGNWIPTAVFGALAVGRDIANAIYVRK